MTDNFSRRIAFVRAELDDAIPDLHDSVVIPQLGSDTYELIVFEDQDKGGGWASVRVTGEALTGEVENFGATLANAVELLTEQLNGTSTDAGRAADAKVEVATRAGRTDPPTSPVDIVSPASESSSSTPATSSDSATPDAASSSVSPSDGGSSSGAHVKAQTPRPAPARGFSTPKPDGDSA